MIFVEIFSMIGNFISGVIFGYYLNDIIGIRILGKDMIFNICICYVVGLLVSRFGTLVVEKVLKKLKCINFANYTDYVVASKKDETLRFLSQINNFFRTIIAMVFLMITAYVLSFFKAYLIEYKTPLTIILGVLVLVLMICSYKKQTEYINKRVQICKGA